MRRFLLTIGCGLAMFGTTVASAQEKQAPAQAPVQKPVQAPTQKMAPVQAPTQKPIQSAAQKPTQKPEQSPVQKGGEPAKMARAGIFTRVR